MIAIKTEIKKMPKYCDECQWYATRPHPYKGWSDLCELMNHCLDDDQEEDWQYGGDGKPEACPLIDASSFNPAQKIGRWVPIGYDGYPVIDGWECSECGWEHTGDDDTLTCYCPNCGTKMEVE